MAKRNDTEQVVLDVLMDEQHPGQDGKGIWLARHKELSNLIDWAWRKQFPDRRNQATYRNIEAALKRLVAEGLVETKVGDYDTYYRRRAA